MKKRTHPQTFILFLISGFVLAYEARSGEPPAEDRKAILAMTGEFEVDFQFAETVSLQKNYQLKKEYQEEASEIVFVVEDTGSRIALQHILVTGNGKGVVKHWKQVWTWEDSQITEFQGRDQWKTRVLPKSEVEGMWSQLVTQVDDSPRYESIGKWIHDGGYSRWQSGTTSRPLPRREHTKRDDYQVLLGINEHALTPSGWIHYQDNIKQVLKEDGSVSHYLARERGLNDYFSTTEVDFTAAKEYWEKTSEYWKRLSAFWDKVVQERPQFKIKTKVDGKSMVELVFEVAEQIRDGKVAIPTQSEVEATILPYLE